MTTPRTGGSGPRPDAVTPESGLRRALEDVGPVLERHGFKLRSVQTGVGSGGPYADATYARGLWRANVYFRYGLEPGWYSHAWHQLPHAALVPAERGARVLTPAEYAQQVEEFAGVVLRGEWRRFWRDARTTQRDSHRALFS